MKDFRFALTMFALSGFLFLSSCTTCKKDAAKEELQEQEILDNDAMLEENPNLETPSPSEAQKVEEEVSSSKEN